ncbi:MAG: NUDIX hydrolase [Planctomycetota bacterium]
MNDRPWLNDLEAVDTRSIDQLACEIRDDFQIGLASFTAVFTPDLDYVLLVQLGDYARRFYDGNPWTLPGGGVKAGESPSMSAIREVKEETAVELADLELSIAGWFSRKYYQSRHAEAKGEIVLLFATSLRERLPVTPNRPEVINACYERMDVKEWLQVPASGTGQHRLQPFPRHWIHWAVQARSVLAGESKVSVVQYENAGEMAEPISP